MMLLMLFFFLCESGEEGNQEEEVRKITSLQLRRSQLAAYCRLTLCGVLELYAASDIFKYYNKVGEEEACACLEIPLSCVHLQRLPCAFRRPGFLVPSQSTLAVIGRATLQD